MAAQPEWRPETWHFLNEDRRLKAIERIEKSFAALEGRDPTPVRELEQRLIDRLTDVGEWPPLGAVHHEKGNPVDVQLLRKLLRETESDRVMLAYFHEEHHVEQLHAVRNPESRPDFSAAQIGAWRASLKTSADAQKEGRKVSYDEYKNYAHEQSARLESARLYARCLNKLPTHEVATDREGSALEQYVYDKSEERTKTDKPSRGFKSRLEQFVHEPASRDEQEPAQPSPAEPANIKEEHEPER